MNDIEITKNITSSGLRRPPGYITLFGDNDNDYGIWYEIKIGEHKFALE